MINAQGGKKIFHVRAEEDQVIYNGAEREQVSPKEGEGDKRQVHNCQILHPDGDDEEKKHLIFRA